MTSQCTDQEYPEAAIVGRSASDGTACPEEDDRAAPVGDGVGRAVGAVAGAVVNAGSAVGAVAGNVGKSAIQAFKETTSKGKGASESSLSEHSGAIVLAMPDPMVDDKELAAFEEATRRYDKHNEKGLLAKAGDKAGDLVPAQLKDLVARAGDTISEQELYKAMMEYLAQGFAVLEQQAARFATSEKGVLDRAAKVTGRRVEDVEQLCFLRGYEVKRVAASFKTRNLAAALGEGAATGAVGVAGIAPNVVFSTFLYYRAVQSIALCYGYDTRNDPDALAESGMVLMEALGASDGASHVGKFMAYGQLAATQGAVRKGWQAAAEQGGLALLVTQIRALAHKSAQKALSKAGKEMLEETMFTALLGQVGKKMTQKAVQRAVPVVGGVIGGLFDTATMKKVIDYANIYYSKMFIAQKEQRIDAYLQSRPISVQPLDAS